MPHLAQLYENLFIAHRSIKDQELGWLIRQIKYLMIFSVNHFRCTSCKRFSWSNITSKIKGIKYMSEWECIRNIYSWQKYNFLRLYSCIFFFQLKSKLFHSNAQCSSTYNDQYSQHNKICKNIFLYTFWLTQIIIALHNEDGIEICIVEKNG